MGVSIDERVFALFDTVRNYALQYKHTHTHTLVSTVTSSLSLFSSGFQRRTFPSLSFQERSPVSVTSFEQQQLTTTEPQQFYN
jgi:hypothetical protein